jgi:hypothetical protein
MQQQIVSVPGVPVYVCDPLRGMVLYMVPYGTPFYTVGFGQVPMQAAAVVEQPAPEGANDEEQEAGDAFVAHVEALNRAKRVVADFGGDMDLDPQEMRIINDLKEAIAADNAEKVMEALQDWDVRAEFDEDEDRVDEEQAHVAQLRAEDEEQARSQPLKDKKEELHRLFRELYKLSEFQKPLYKAVKEMEAEENPKKREKNKTNYWETWNRMVAAQKDWLGTLETLKALDAEIAALDPGHEFNTLANKTWYPDEPDRDYLCLYAMISRNFKGNISRDEKRRANMHKSAAGKSAPAPATLAEMMSAQLAKEAAGGSTSWGDI